MAQKVIKAGDTLAVTLSREVIEALHLQEGSQVALELGADRHHALLPQGTIPIKEVDSIFAQQVADFIEQYQPALEALAK